MLPVNYLADFNGPITLGTFSLLGLTYYDVGRYVFFPDNIPNEFKLRTVRLIETSDLDPSVYYWDRNRVDRSKEGCRLTEEDKQEMTLMMLQSETWHQ